MNLTKMILWSALMGAGCVYGQNQTFSSAVYFETGKSQISAKDSLELEKLAQKLKAVGDYEISIMAYTDDRGSAEDNQRLAASRSLSVTEFLQRHQLPAPSRQTVQPVGEIALGNSKNIEETRRQNRRVDIVVSCFAPKDVNELFSYFSERNKNQFNYNGSNDTSFFGKKGTMLNVPAGAFVLAGGKKGAVKYPVQVELREAYTFGDMLAHNVSTTSNGKLIQTGGMVYVGAKDADGNELVLDKGKEIEVGMPAKGKLPEGMQVFVSDRAGHDNATSTNWQPQATPFVQNNFGEMLVRVANYRPGTAVPKLDLSIFKTVRGGAREFPDSVQQTLPTAPNLPKLVEVKAVEPTLESVKKQYKQQKKEKAEAYEARIAKQLENQKKSYERKLKERTIRQQEYERAMEKYALDMKAYEQALKAYDANQMQAKDFFLDWVKGDSSSAYVQLYRQAAAWEQVSKDLRQRMEDAQRQFYYLDYYINACKRHKLDSFANEFIAIRTELKQHKQYSNRDWNRAHASVLSDWGSLGRSAGLDFIHHFAVVDPNAKRKDPVNPEYVWGNIARSITKGENWALYLSPMRDSVAGEANIPNVAQVFYKRAVAKYAAYDEAAFASFVPRLDSLRAMSIDSSLSGRMVELCKALNKKIKAREIEDAKNSLNNMDNGNIANLGSLSQNLAKVGNLGWINCDRFYNDPSLMMTQVNCPTQEEDACFMVFTELSLVVALQRTAQGFKIPDGYQGVPADAKVKVIGLRAKDGKVESFQIDSRPRNLASQKPSFKPTKVAELADLFANI